MPSVEITTESCTYRHLKLIESWISSGDLFDMLLPMLSIYQEYVRNHHYSLQVSYHVFLYVVVKGLVVICGRCLPKEK